MALKAKEIVVHVRKGLMCSLRTVYRSGCRHPLVWSMMLFLLILYRYLPSLFSSVAFSSPTVVCAALLLGTLLIYGDANIPKKEDEQNNLQLKSVSFAEELEITEWALANEQKSGEGAKAALSIHVGSSLSSHLQPADGHGAFSGSESDHSESSSPDASVADIIPMLDELHPLLNFDAPQAVLKSVDDSDAASSETYRDQELDDGSVEVEMENQEDEVQEEKDDANEVVLKWTADDQKNLMDLGTSELERNQRMENLIARRRSRKFPSFHGEENLIDMDGIDPVPNMQDHPRFNLQISSISAPRTNPFDIPFGYETMGLPPVPASAPPVLQPRWNPFDVPYNQGEQNSVPASLRGMFFQRHENFSMGASSSSVVFKEEAQESVLKPYVVAERMDSGGPAFISLGQESNEKGDSKVSSSDESDTTLSEIDTEDHSNLVEPEIHRNHYVEHVEGDSKSSDEVDSVDAPHEQIGVDEGSNMVMDASTLSEERHQIGDAFGAVEMEIRQGEYCSHDSDAGNLEVIEERYDGSSSSSLEAYDSHSKMGNLELGNPEQVADNSLTFVDDSVQSVSADSDLSRKVERVDDSQVADPVYDSSPSAVENPLSNGSAVEDALPLSGKECFTSDGSLTSGIHTCSAEEESAPRPHGEEISSAAALLEPYNEGIWVASSSLSIVDEIESRSREITEIREGDVIQVELSGMNAEFSHPISPKLPRFLLPSHLLIAGLNNSPFGGDATINNGESSNSRVTAKPLTPRELSTVLQPDRASLRRFPSIEDLPPIPEEHSEYLRMEDEYDSMI